MTILQEDWPDRFSFDIVDQDKDIVIRDVKQ